MQHFKSPYGITLYEYSYMHQDEHFRSLGDTGDMTQGGMRTTSAPHGVALVAFLPSGTSRGSATGLWL